MSLTYSTTTYYYFKKAYFLLFDQRNEAGFLLIPFYSFKRKITKTHISNAHIYRKTRKIIKKHRSLFLDRYTYISNFRHF